MGFIRSLMGYLGLARRASGEALSEDDDGDVWDLFRVGRSSAGVRVTPESALKTSAVLACVRVLSEGIAQLPMHIYEKKAGGRRSKAENHPLQKALRNPNGWQTAFEFREMMMVCLCLRGNFYAEIKPGVNGAVTELWPIHPDRVDIERLPNGRLRYQVSDAQGRKKPYTQDEIFHIKWFSLDGVKGETPITYAAQTIGEDQAAGKYNATFYKNGASPGVLLETDKPIPKETRRETLREWNEMHAGSDNAHRTGILTHGLKAKNLGISQRDAQYLEQRHFNIEEIARIYRVALHLIGHLLRSTNNNIEQQSLEFVKFTLAPWIVRIEQAADRDLIADNDRFYIKINVGGFARGDQKARSEFYREMINCGIMTINEARELEDLDPVEGGDVHLVQGAMVPLDRILNPPAPSPPPPLPAPSKDDQAAMNALRSSVVTFEAMLSVERSRNDAAKRRLLALRRERAAQRKALEQARSAIVVEKAAAADLQTRLDAVQKSALDLQTRLAEETARATSLDERCQALDEQCNKWAAEFNDAYATGAEAAKRIETAFVAVEQVLAERAAAMLDMERDAIRRAANKPNFVTALDDVREKTVKRMSGALVGAAKILEAIHAPVNLDASIAAYVERSHAALLDAADQAKTTDELVAAVETVLSSWQARPAEFVSGLLKQEKASA